MTLTKNLCPNCDTPLTVLQLKLFCSTTCEKQALLIRQFRSKTHHIIHRDQYNANEWRRINAKEPERVCDDIILWNTYCRERKEREKQERLLKKEIEGSGLIKRRPEKTKNVMDNREIPQDFFSYDAEEWLKNHTEELNEDTKELTTKFVEPPRRIKRARKERPIPVRGPYEVTINLEFPTTETLEIPSEWIESKCSNCGRRVYVDGEQNKIHHRMPFCDWWMNIWHNQHQMTIEVGKILSLEPESIHDKNIRIKKLLENRMHLNTGRRGTPEGVRISMLPTKE